MFNSNQNDDIFSVLLKSNGGTVDEEYFELEDQFEKTFGYRVPRALLPDRISDDDVKKAMAASLEKKEDVLFSFLGVMVD